MAMNYMGQSQKNISKSYIDLEDQIFAKISSDYRFKDILYPFVVLDRDENRVVLGSSKETVNKVSYNFSLESAMQEIVGAIINDKLINIVFKIAEDEALVVKKRIDKKSAQKKQQAEAQYNLNLFHSQFLQSMRDAWAHAVDHPQTSPRWTTDGKYKGVFLDNFFQSMNFMKQLIIQVWETGAVPEFKEIHFEQEAFWSLFEKLDKYDNYHQSKEDGNLATIHFGENDQYKFHACQGLNMCKGMGHDGSGSQPGDGDCATVVPHNCSQGNDCKYQGGCAFAPYAAIDNTCRMEGGCQTPISPVQVMAGGSDVGTLVWDVARKQLAGRLKKNVKDLPAIAVNERRQKVRPSNPKKA